MKSLILVLFLQHAVIAARAGLVTFAEGFITASSPMVGEGETFTTGRGSRLEIMLTPSSYFRLDAHSEAVLESAELDSVVVRLKQGAAIVEVVEIDRKMPIRVLVGNQAAVISRAGSYRFTESAIGVLNGKLSVDGLDNALSKGWKLEWSGDVAEPSRMDRVEVHPIDLWNQERNRKIFGSTERRPAARTQNDIVFPHWRLSPF